MALVGSLVAGGDLRAADSTEAEPAAKAVWQARGAKAGQSTAAVSHEQSLPARLARGSGEPSHGSRSLAWRARGVQADASVEVVEPAPREREPWSPDEVDPRAPRKVILERDAHVRRIVIDEPAALSAVPAEEESPRRAVRRLPVMSSRSKIRDSVMQVSSVAPDGLTDPLDRAEPAKNDTALPLEEAAEPARPSDLSSEDLPSLRNDTDPFPDDQLPESLPDDSAPTAPSRRDEPYDVDPSIPGSDPTIPDIESPATTRAERSCDEEKKECLQAIEDLRGRDIKKIFVGLRIEGDNGRPAIEGRDFPCECALGLRTSFQGRDWSQTTFTWKATSQCHKPLYFEDVALERYGHAWNPVVQPFMSAAHFFGSVPLLPYKMGLTPPNECMYTLGYYRPGNCAPYMLDPIPLSLRAGAFQALGVTGFAFWFWPPVSAP
jgi:hypothetical protein